MDVPLIHIPGIPTLPDIDLVVLHRPPTQYIPKTESTRTMRSHLRTPSTLSLHETRTLRTPSTRTLRLPETRTLHTPSTLRLPETRTLRLPETRTLCTRKVEKTPSVYLKRKRYESLPEKLDARLYMTELLHAGILFLPLEKASLRLSVPKGVLTRYCHAVGLRRWPARRLRMIRDGKDCKDGTKETKTVKMLEYISGSFLGTTL